MKAIGGYFELELNDGHEWHASAMRLNTARNVFEYVLRAEVQKGASAVLHVQCNA